MQKFCMGVYLGTGPAWLLYTLHAQQWNIGMSKNLDSLIRNRYEFKTDDAQHERIVYC